MKRSIIHILSPLDRAKGSLCAIFFLLLLLSVSAQPHGGPHNAPAVKIKVSVDSTRIIIGQPFHMLIEVYAPGNTSLTWPALDSLPHFEWLEKGRVDSTIKPDEQYYRQYFTLTSFDSGTWAIPRLSFVSGNRKYFSDSVRVVVDYSKFDPNKDFHDIKDIIDIPNPYAKWIPWFVVGITLVALVLIVWLVRKKKLMKQAAAKPVVLLTPYEEAIRQLEELQKQGPGEDGQIKVYYTRLNDVLRLFILRRLGIASMAETNEELIGQIRRLPLTTQQFDELAETLRMADFVKFAKYQPAATDNEHSFQVIRQSVDHLNEIGQEREREMIAQMPADKKVLPGQTSVDKKASASPSSGEKKDKNKN